MKIGLKDLRQIKNDYYIIDDGYFNGDLWVLYEHNEYGDEVKSIGINLTKKFYVYTWESLTNTVENLEEYTLYRL